MLPGDVHYAFNAPQLLALGEVVLLTGLIGTLLVVLYCALEDSRARLKSD